MLHTRGVGSLVGKYKEKKPRKRPGRRWKDNNKSDFGEKKIGFM